MPVLGKVGLVNKGTYNASTAYTALDFVKYNGSSFVALKGVQGVTPSDDGTNWAYLAKGVDVAVANSQTVTTPGTALDAVQANKNVNGSLAYLIDQEITSLNDSLANLSTDVSTNYATKTDLATSESKFSLTHAACTGTSNVTECSINCDYNNDVAYLTGTFIGKAGTYTQGQTLFTLPIQLKTVDYVWIPVWTMGGINNLRVRKNGIVEFNSSVTITGQPYIFVNGVVPR